MKDDVNLYPEPADTLRREVDYLRERLKEERAEADRYRGMRLEAASLEALISAAEDDAAMTASLIKDYKAAIRRVDR